MSSLLNLIRPNNNDEWVRTAFRLLLTANLLLISLQLYGSCQSWHVHCDIFEALAPPQFCAALLLLVFSLFKLSAYKGYSISGLCTGLFSLGLSLLPPLAKN